VPSDYGGPDRFPDLSPELMRAVDQADSAQYSLEEVLVPTGWVPLNFMMDSRTGLGRFREFRISNYQLMIQLIDACQRYGTDDILQLPDVRERVDLYHQQAEAFITQLQRCTPSAGTWWSSTCGLRRSSLPGTASWSMRCFPPARCRCTCCGRAAPEHRARGGQVDPQPRL
jgi:hypothetical protein